jgi:tetratricopeptide (TPR) repeat protein
VHAPLGLRAARAYSGIAPDAAHAQHMTTHIFVAVGMWDDVVSQNELAAGPDTARWLPGHYTYWLLYGYLQQGRYERARQHLDALRAHAMAAVPPRPGFVATASRADYVVNTERWDSPVLEWPPVPATAAPALAATDAFVRGFAAVRRGDPADTGEPLRTLQALVGRTRAITDPNDNSATVVAILDQELRAATLHAEGRSHEAVALLREAAALEDAMAYEFGPPVIVKPTHELLGETLLSLDRPAEAQHAFERSLQRTPGRTLSLLGLARAASRAGDPKTAARAYAQLRDIWHAADPDIPGLDEARRSLAAR